MLKSMVWTFACPRRKKEKIAHIKKGGKRIIQR
jgi:hypothetical protein